MQVQYVISPYPTLLEDMVVKIWENSNLGVGAEVQTIVIPEKNGAGVPTPGAGHQVQNTLVITGLDRVPHTVKLLTASGTQLHSFVFEPKENVVTVFTPIYFKIGDGGTNTPVAATSSYSNTDLAGVETFDYIIHRNGTLLYPGVHFIADPLGGFSFVVDGDVWGEEDEVLIERNPIVVENPVNDSVVGKQWGATTGNPNIYVDVTSNVNYAATHLRKVIRLSGSGQYHFNVAPPVGYPFRIINQVSGNPTVHFDAAPLIRPGGDVSTFTLPTKGVIEVVYDGTKFNLTVDNTDSLGTMPYASITQMGTLNIGDTSPAGTTFTVSINNQGTTNYMVVGTLRNGVNNVNNVNNTTNAWTVSERTATSFKVTFRDILNKPNDLRFDWMIVKAN